MGWTSSSAWRTTQDAINDEYSGVEILRQSGNWVLCRTPNGFVSLDRILIERHDGGIFIKEVPITWGPNDVPPAAIARAYIALFDGDIEKAGGQYGTGLLRAALKPRVALTAGSRMRFSAPGYWSDGVAIAGDYTYLGKFRARRSDGQTVRLPRSWRRQLLSPA